jgi:hydroxymethylpyrimidine pyrophosphatase-like HAD family hydrolase
MTTTYDTSRQPERHLVALDIDGTIAIPGTTAISNAVRDSVADARDAGHDIVLASGRSLAGMLPIADTLGLTEGWVSASNGAVVAHLDTRAPDGYRLHNVRTFDPASVVRRARSTFPGARVATEVIGRGYRVTHLFAPHELNGEQKLVDLEEATERRTTRLILSTPGIVDLRDELAACGVTVNPDNNNWLDITPLGLSKATALEDIRRQLGVDPSRTIAVGDGPNDLEMLAWAHDGVAMGHAPTQVQDAADHVTGTLQGDGAATVLRSLLLETVSAGR